MICRARTSSTESPVLSVEVKVAITMVTTSPVTTTDTVTVSLVKHGSPPGVEQLMFPFTVVDE